MDEELAEFIGIYVGDGSGHFRPNKNSYEFKIVGNPKDEIGYYSFVSLLASTITNRKIRPKILDGGRSVGVRFCSKKLFEKMRKISESRTPQTLKQQIPPKILRRRKLAIALLRGLFDTDGCFTIKRKYKIQPYYPVVSFSQENANVVKQVAKVIAALKISASACLNKKYIDKRTGKTHQKSRIDIYGANNTAKWFQTIGTHNPKIRERYQAFLAKRTRGPYVRKTRERKSLKTRRVFIQQ